MSQRLAIPSSRNQLTQTVQFTGQALYISIDYYSSPARLYRY